MSFYVTSENIRIEQSNGRNYLVGRARREDSSMKDVRLDLDEFIGNHGGRFEWGGKDFTRTAENVRFNFEGGANVPVLRAILKNAEGNPMDADLNLGERIKNIDGDLVYA
ncbi:Cyanovirin-N [Choiromyces venosus 120613-1]|uniref:Cyanovirin-N n=1 Tax=Choiromyces venosus 120613-1 TaxID=1336337 RepID=A0A3N4J9J3_9PEZI|nr:Cyanovirin-N [Choiromyces venosus 120613-1]